MASNASLPDHYATLGIPETATSQQIRDAYKMAALKNHPDRVPANSPQRAERTRAFQRTNDAYYALSDAGRRREYDALRREQRCGYAGSSTYSTYGDGDTASARQRASDAQFADIFEEMLREEGMANAAGPTAAAPSAGGSFYSTLGGLGGAALGFIVANVPGLVAGAIAGKCLGAVRDTRGKSVYEAFQELPADDRARLLGQMAARVLSHIAS